jgi:hypothetical protein
MKTHKKRKSKRQKLCDNCGKPINLRDYRIQFGRCETCVKKHPIKLPNDLINRVKARLPDDANMKELMEEIRKEFKVQQSIDKYRNKIDELINLMWNYLDTANNCAEEFIISEGDFAEFYIYGFSNVNRDFIRENLIDKYFDLLIYPSQSHKGLLTFKLMINKSHKKKLIEALSTVEV